MHLTSIPSAPEPTSSHDELVGAPLSVVFSDPDDLRDVRQRGVGEIKLEPPFHLSSDDLYLVLPSDIGMEFVDILADSDKELLDESIDEGLVAYGAVRKTDTGVLSLVTEEVYSPRTLLKRLEYAAEVAHDATTLDRVNRLDHLQCTVLSATLDAAGLESLLTMPEYIGPSWRAPTGTREPVDPTHVWSRRDAGGIGIELALFREYDELIAYLKPLRVLLPAT